MKRSWRPGILVVAGVILLGAAGAWMSWRLELRRLRSPQSILFETGLQLPAHAQITATQAHLFSLVDGENFAWHTQSDTSLLPWAMTNLQPETGGWKHIQDLAELGFPDEMPRGAKFAGVWRASRHTNRGRQETSYLHLAEDGRVGILSTFRP